MKAPTHATPSGDRTIAQLLLKMLRNTGDDIRLISTLRMYLKSPSDFDNKRLCAEQESHRLIANYRNPTHSWQPDIWFTYHNYYRAPDLIGPYVARELNIPYVIAEPSLAPHRGATEWADAYRAVETALLEANHLWALNEKDLLVLRQYSRLGQKTTLLGPFVDASPASALRKSVCATGLVPKRRPNSIKLVTVAMARPGKKQQGFQELCAIIDRLPRHGWHLSIVGDVTTPSVSKPITFLKHHPCVTILGQMERDELRQLFARSDLFVWPGPEEAVGLAILEALSSGLPVIAYHTPGTNMTIEHGCTGLLVTKRNRHDFAESIRGLILSGSRRLALGQQARRHARDCFNLDTKGAYLSQTMAKIVTTGRAC